MDESIFTKMKVKPGMCAKVLHPPIGYPFHRTINWTASVNPDFVHLFVSSKSQYEQCFLQAATLATQNALVWLSYPKSTKGQKYDINRDSLWDLLIPYGWHPVAQISLDETWSAIRIRRNELGAEYARPKGRGGVCDEQ